MPASAIEYDPFLAGTDEDPYPLYARLRDEAPVYYSEEYDFYAISRFDDVVSMSREWKSFSNAHGVDVDHTGDYFGPNFLDSDPPRHRLMRSLVQSRFSPKSVREALEPVIRKRVAELLDEVKGREEVDIAAEFAWPLPFSMACHLLGFPESDSPFLREGSRRFMEREPHVTLPPPDAQVAAKELRGYIAETVADRRRHPTGDMVSLLVQAEVDGKPLSDPEIIGNSFLLFDAGTLTTACLLTNSLVLFNQHPEKREWLANHPQHIPQAIEEILRFEAPIQHSRRTTLRDVELHGEVVPEGATVVLLWASANRDPARWEEPDTLDFEREAKRHISFSEGIHHCLGAPIARLEGAIALEALLPHLENFRLTGPGERIRGHELRGFVHLPAAMV